MALGTQGDGWGLDLGCGSNPHATFLLESAGYRVVGTEFAVSYARLARRLARARGSRADFVVCDGSYLPFKPCSFSTVLISEVLEHVPNDRAVVDEIHATLRSGGLALVTVPNRSALPLWTRRTMDRVRGHRYPDDWYFDPCHSDLRRYTRPALDHLFQRFLRVRYYRVVPFEGSVTGRFLGLAMRLPPLDRLGLSVAAAYRKFSPTVSPQGGEGDRPPTESAW